MNSLFVHRSLHLNLAATAVALLIAAPAFGDFLINDTFDADAVGSTPPGWTFGPGYLGAANPTVVRYVTNNISNPPSAPNVLMSDAPDGSPGYLNTRTFASTVLPTDRPLVISFDFRLDRIDQVFNGFNFDIITTIGGGQEPFAHPRVFGGPATYTLYSDNSGAHALAPGLVTGNWYNLAFSINFTNNNGSGGTGFTTWTLSNHTTSTSMLLTNESFTLTSFIYTNISSVEFYDYVSGQGGDRLFLDNVQISMIPEPTTALLLGAGVWLFWRARNGRKA